MDVPTLQTTSCPACGHLAEVVDRDVWESTDGPVEHVRVRCVQRHAFFGPAASLLVATGAPHAGAPEATRVVRHAEGRA